MPIVGTDLDDAPWDIVGPCLKHLDPERKKRANRIFSEWDSKTFFELLAGCDATTQYKCLNAIIEKLSTISGKDGFVHIKDTLEKGKPSLIGLNWNRSLPCYPPPG